MLNIFYLLLIFYGLKFPHGDFRPTDFVLCINLLLSYNGLKFPQGDFRPIDFVLCINPFLYVHMEKNWYIFFEGGNFLTVIFYPLSFFSWINLFYFFFFVVWFVSILRQIVEYIWYFTRASLINNKTFNHYIGFGVKHRKNIKTTVKFHRQNIKSFTWNYVMCFGPWSLFRGRKSPEFALLAWCEFLEEFHFFFSSLSEFFDWIWRFF